MQARSIPSPRSASQCARLFSSSVQNESRLHDINPVTSRSGTAAYDSRSAAGFAVSAEISADLMLATEKYDT